MIEFFGKLPPGFVLIFGGMMLPLMHHPLKRAALLLMIPVLAAIQLFNVINLGQPLVFSVAGFEVDLLYRHDFSLIFATIFILAAFAGALFGLFQAKTNELTFAFIYAGSAVTIVFCKDFIGLFLFWELMAIASSLLIISASTKEAVDAALRYMALHFFGGVILFAGIAAYYQVYGTLDIGRISIAAESMLNFSELSSEAIAAWLILIGILVNAAAPPLSAWIADAYPKSTEFGSVFLSAFTTKVAVFALLTMFPGCGLLISIGLFMIFYGIFLAVIENNMRRMLSYSIVTQVGFMIVGIGIGSKLALLGVALHAFGHIIYKALLFMTAGSVVYVTGKQKCTELGGLYKTMRLTLACGIIGAMTASAFPLTLSFLSKSFIIGSALKTHAAIVWFMMIAASAGVFLQVGLVFVWFVFFNKDSGLRPVEPPVNMRIAMIFMSLLCLILAIPAVAEVTVYKLLPTIPDYHVYTANHVVGQLQLLLFALLAFFLMLSLLQRSDTTSLDFDWVYRKLFLSIVKLIEVVTNKITKLGFKLIFPVYKISVKGMREVYGPGGVMSRSWPIGVTAMWLLVFVGGYLLLYYF